RKDGWRGLIDGVALTAGEDTAQTIPGAVLDTTAAKRIQPQGAAARTGVDADGTSRARAADACNRCAADPAHHQTKVTGIHARHSFREGDGEIDAGRVAGVGVRACNGSHAWRSEITFIRANVAVCISRACHA